MFPVVSATTKEVQIWVTLPLSQARIDGEEHCLLAAQLAFYTTLPF